MNSKKKNASEYSFAWFTSDLFQQSIIQTGISKAVNCIKIKANPSIPKIRFILIIRIQSLISRNWNCVDVGSKKNKSEKLTFKINRDQKSEKLRIKRILVYSIKTSTKQPINGS